MAEPRRIFAFDALAAAMRRRGFVTPGVTIASRTAHAMFNVRGDSRNTDLLREALDVFGVELPLTPNTASARCGVRALWLGPNEWLIVTASPPVSAGHPLFRFQESALGAERIVSRSGASKMTVTDVSHGRAVLRLEGPDARNTLAKGCPLDLDARVFPVDACAQTAIAKINLIIDHAALDVFDLYCHRSYAGSFWEWINEAAAEYGLNIG